MHNVNQQVSYSREKRNTNRVTLSRHSNARAIRRPSANSLMASSSCVFIINNQKHVVTTSVNSRRPSVHKRLMTPLFGNCFSAITSLLFAIDRKEQTLVFLESVNSCVYMQIFNFRDGHVTTLRHHSGAYICQMPGHRLSRLAKGIQSESLLSIGVKLFPVGSAQDSRRVPKTRKMLFWIWLRPRYKVRESFTIAPVLTSTFDSLPPKSRRRVVFIQDLGCVTSIKKHLQSFWFGLEPPTHRSRCKSAHKCIPYNNRCVQNFIQIG